MKNIFLLCTCICLFQFANAQTPEQETDAIRTVCNYYLDGGTNGDSIMFSKAFHPDGLMLYMRNDTVQKVLLKDFMARMQNSGKKSDRITRIEKIEVYGNAALAKLTIEQPTFYLHDIMSLLKTKDGWKIVGKIFSRQNK